MFADMYAFEVLRFLVRKAKNDSSEMSESERLLYAQVIGKWECLLEVLQGTMINTSSAAGSTPLFRKRHLDVACTISELHQRQRCRVCHNEEDANAMEVLVQQNGGRSKRQAEIESALLTYLHRHCLATQLDDEILDKMLPNELGGDTTNFIGNLLLKYAKGIEARLGYIYKPGSQRVRSVVTRNKCTQLVAMAVLAAEKDSLEEARKINSNVPEAEQDEVRLTRMLSEGSQLCEQLENMVSFLVTTEAAKRKTAASLNPGEQLCALAVKCAPVSQGVALWAREITKSSDFVILASLCH
jgi:hypothetical protein